MKKRSVILFSILILCLIPMVYAFSVNDFLTNVFSISGRVTGDLTCTDSDGGKIFNIQGTTIGFNGKTNFKRIDSCFISSASRPFSLGNLPVVYSVREYYCENNVLKTTTQKCTKGCKDGACLPHGSIPTCTENWVCGKWSSCMNNNQTRECNDINYCGNIANKPITEQRCNIEPPTSCVPVDSYKIEKSGNKFNLGQTLYDIDSSITDTEFDSLSKGTLIDNVGENTGNYGYVQSIEFTNASTGQFVFAADTSGNRAERPAGTYLKFSSAENRWAWNYILKIIGPKVNVKDRIDLENDILNIAGKDWTINGVVTSNTSYGLIDKIILLNGVDKMVLEDGKKVSINNEDIDNSLVYISGNDKEANIPGFKILTISYQPEDDVFLAEKESLIDPIFGVFNIYFDKINQEVYSNEDIVTVDLVGDKVKVKMKNKNGNLFDDYLCYTSNGKINYGYSALNKMAINNGEIVSTTSSIKNLKGTRFLMSFGGISHIVEIQEIDTINKKLTIKILDTGEVYKDVIYTNGQPSIIGTNIDPYLMHSVILIIDENKKSITFNNINDGNPVWYTLNGDVVSFKSACSQLVISENEKQGLEQELIGKKISLYAGIKYDSTLNKIVWLSTGLNALGPQIILQKINDNSMYEYAGMSQLGTYIRMNQQEDGLLSVSLPKEPLSADVYLQTCNKF
ncbi:MAG: hypothetical protein PHF86_05970 [Candidatus Nanoarchaeia archaeon]|nr:hypothetical protein [Candidatus Nanoarchaeia archaeon]